MKSADQSEKKWATMIIKKGIMKETEKCIEKGKRYYEENIERLQKIA